MLVRSVAMRSGVIKACALNPEEQGDKKCL